MITVGITGGIGSGKTIVSTLLQAMGYPVFNADIESKRLCNTSPILIKKLSEAFGSDIYQPDGSLNRAYFASIIFSDKNKLQLANEIIHPEVKNAFLNWAQNQNSSIVFIESAILLESILSNAIDKVILVYASEETRVARVMRRESVSAETVYPRIGNQKSFVELKEKAHYLIDNDDNRLLIPQIETILTSLSSDI